MDQQPDVITSAAAINLRAVQGKFNSETKRLAWFFSPSVWMSGGGAGR